MLFYFLRMPRLRALLRSLLIKDMEQPKYVLYWFFAHDEAVRRRTRTLSKKMTDTIKSKGGSSL